MGSPPAPKEPTGLDSPSFLHESLITKQETSHSSAPSLAHKDPSKSNLHLLLGFVATALYCTHATLEQTTFCTKRLISKGYVHLVSAWGTRERRTSWQDHSAGERYLNCTSLFRLQRREIYQAIGSSCWAAPVDQWAIFARWPLTWQQELRRWFSLLA